MGSIENSQNAPTRVFRNESPTTQSVEKEISYTPPKFVLRTLTEHGIKFDPAKHLVFTAPGSTQFFLQKKGSTNIIPFETTPSFNPMQNAIQSTHMETPAPSNNFLTPNNPESIVPDLEKLGASFEQATKAHEMTPVVAEAPAVVMPDVAPVSPEVKAPVVEVHIPTIGTIETPTLSLEQEKTYTLLNNWWEKMPVPMRSVIASTLIHGGVMAKKKEVISTGASGGSMAPNPAPQPGMPN